MRPDLLLGVFLFVLHYCESAKILGVFPVPSISHQIIFQPIWKELSLRGHQVTVLTPNPLKENLPNLTEIDVSFIYSKLTNSSPMQNIFSGAIGSYIGLANLIHELGITVLEEEIKYGSVQNLLKDENNNFDLLILQKTHSFNLVLGFAAKYNAPVVGISSMDIFLHSHDILGNPTHPIISPDPMLNFHGHLSFFNKVQSFVYNFSYRMFHYWYALPKDDKIARKYFGDDMPYLGDLEKNVSLMLVNLNPIIHDIRPNVPNMIEINQIHIKKRKPLPKDIQDFLDSASEGVVYFSLGSNVKSANLPKRLIEEIVSGLAELPYEVLWKWETDHLPNQPNNVMIGKWLPQQDILAHPNVKVFVTQGGAQSIEEAITFEVPMVAIPFAMDQPANVRRLVNKGLAIEVNYQTLTKERIRDAILKVAQDEKFKEEILKAKAILTDQPLKGVDKAIWWIEYVLRHKGAKHLRSQAADMSFFEYFMIDVVVFLLGCSVAILYCIFKASQLIISLFKVKRKLKKQ